MLGFHRLLVLVTTTIALAATACGTQGGAGEPPAAASPPSDTEADQTDEADTTTDVRLRVVFGPAALGPPACEGASCVVPLTRTSTTVSGSLTGTSVSGGVGSPGEGGGYVGVGIHRFTGEVERCGTGTLVWTETITSADGSEVSGTWSIVPASGTGELSSIEGGGTFEGTATADGGGTVDAIGEMECGAG